MASDDHGNDNNRPYWSPTNYGGSIANESLPNNNNAGDSLIGANNNYGIGNYQGSKREAEYTYRDMYRAQWADYKNRFLPYQEELINAVTSRDMLDEQLSRISATSESSKKLSAEAAAITRGRYGMAQTQQQQQSFNSNLNLNSALGLANSENNARSSAYDRYQSAMTGAAMRPEQVQGQTGGATS